MPVQPLLEKIRDAVKAKSTEQGEVGATERLLMSAGWLGRPEVVEHLVSGKKVRVYQYRDTPAGDFDLVTGPQRKGEIGLPDDFEDDDSDELETPDETSDEVEVQRANPLPRIMSPGEGVGPLPSWPGTSPGAFLRENPPKGPQPGDYSASGYYPAEDEAQLFYSLEYATIAKNAKGNDSQWSRHLSDAERAATIRAYIKDAGLSSYLAVTKGDTSVYDVEIEVAKGAVPGVSFPVLDDLPELAKAKIRERFYAWDYTGKLGQHIWLKISGQEKDNSDIYSDYYSPAGWKVPAKYVRFMKALIASTAKANGYTLTQEGQDALGKITGKVATASGAPVGAPEVAGAPAAPASMPLPGVKGTVVIDFTPGEGVTVTGDTYTAKEVIKGVGGFFWYGPGKFWYLKGTKGIQTVTAKDQAAMGKLAEALQVDGFQVMLTAPPGQGVQAPAQAPVTPAPVGSPAAAVFAAMGLATSLEYPPPIQWTDFSLAADPTWEKIGGIEALANVKIKPGTQKGSNPGGDIVIDGHKFYAKFPQGPMAETRARWEALAAQLYRAVGLTVPDVRHGKVNGKWAVLSPWMEGLHKADWSATGFGSITEYLGRSWLFDAWLANWDVVGLDQDNLLEQTQPFQDFVRIDVGGCLTFRAQGEPKPFPATQVDELATMQTAKSQVGPVLARLPGKIKHEQAAGVFRDMLPKVKDDLNKKIYDLVLWAVTGAEQVSVKDTADLTQALQNRVQYILGYTENWMPQAPAIGKPVKTLKDVAKKPLSSLPKGTLLDQPILLGVDNVTYEVTAAALGDLPTDSLAVVVDDVHESPVNTYRVFIKYVTGKNGWSELTAKGVGAVSFALGLPDPETAQALYLLSVGAPNEDAVQFQPVKQDVEKYKEIVGEFLGVKSVKSDAPMDFSNEERKKKKANELMNAILDADKNSILASNNPELAVAWKLGKSSTWTVIPGKHAAEVLAYYDFITPKNTAVMQEKFPAYGITAISEDQLALAAKQVLEAGNAIKVFTHEDQLPEYLLTVPLPSGSGSVPKASSLPPMTVVSHPDWTVWKLSPTSWAMFATKDAPAIFQAYSKTPTTVGKLQMILHNAGVDASVTNVGDDTIENALELAESSQAPVQVYQPGTLPQGLIGKPEVSTPKVSTPTPAPAPSTLQVQGPAIEVKTSTGSYQWVKGPAGNRLLQVSGLKPEHQQSIFAAMLLYEALGAAVAGVMRKPDGSILLDVGDGWTIAQSQADVEPFREQLSSEFPVDAYLANWSVFGPKAGTWFGIAISPDKTTYKRILGQGALGYRWSGTPKALEPSVPELESLLNAGQNAGAAHMFGLARVDERWSPITFDAFERCASFSLEALQHVDKLAGTSYAGALHARSETMRKALDEALSQVGASTAPTIGVKSPEQRKAKKEKEKGPVTGAGALITDGHRVLLTKRAKWLGTYPGAWTIPGGAMDSGEKPHVAAKREALEELGAVPSKMTWSGITLTAEFPEKQTTFHTAIFLVPKSVADDFKPWVGVPKNEFTREIDGWAWVDVDELLFSDAGVEWKPKLIPGMSHPVEYESESGEVQIKPVLQIWAENQGAWAEAAKAVKSEKVGGSDVAAILEKALASAKVVPIPFDGDLKKNPLRLNPEGYTLSGVRKDDAGVPYIEYRPRLPDGSRPRIRVGLEAAAVASAQAAQEMREAMKASRLGLEYPLGEPLDPKHSLVGSGLVTASGEPIWPEFALPKFLPAVVAVLGIRRPSRADLLKAAVLELVGLPLEEAVPEASAVTAAATVAHQAEKTLPIGKAKLTKQQVETVNGLAKALIELLGVEPSPSSGKAAKKPDLAKAYKEKIDEAIVCRTSTSNDTSERVAQYIRWLALARKVGLWANRVDPGARVVFRGTGLASVASVLWSEEGKRQTEAMVKVGLSGFMTGKSPDLIQAAIAWLKAQSGASGMGFIRGNRSWESMAAKSLIPTASLSGFESGQNADYGKLAAIPTWAGEPWANVYGFLFDFAGWKYTQPKTQGATKCSPQGRPAGDPAPLTGWTITPSQAAGWGSSAGLHAVLRSNTSWSEGFVMLPGKKLAGSMPFAPEGEILHVDMGDQTPMPAEFVQVTKGGTMTRLREEQIKAFALARPPYPKGGEHVDMPDGYHLPEPIQESIKENPARGRVAYQALVFDRHRFDLEEAVGWAKEHGYQVREVLELPGQFWIEQAPREAFVGELRTVRVTTGVQVLQGRLR